MVVDGDVHPSAAVASMRGLAIDTPNTASYEDPKGTPISNYLAYLTWVVRPMFCMGLNIQTQYPL